MKGIDMEKRIDIIVTTISGSILDWKKINNIEPEFRKCYSGPINVHIVDSHAKAREKTSKAVEEGSRIIISAGGSGTFNSVLEGCYAAGLPKDLRLAFLRKGSADLLGKVLKIPDQLSQAVGIISQSIKEDKIIQADVIEVEGTGIDDKPWKRHFIGFGGVGVFGDVPYFSERWYSKYYKGILGTLFGDRGPFIVTVILSLMKHYIDIILQRKFKFSLVSDDLLIPPQKYSSIIILNGDLGKDFSLAKGIPLKSGYFITVTMRDLGLFTSVKQLIHIGKGDIFNYSKKLGTESFKLKNLKIIPDNSKPYMVNIDGLPVYAKGNIKYRISDTVNLITG